MTANPGGGDYMPETLTYRQQYAEAIASALEGAMHEVDCTEAAETLAKLADQWRQEIPASVAQARTPGGSEDAEARTEAQGVEIGYLCAHGHYCFHADPDERGACGSKKVGTVSLTFDAETEYDDRGRLLVEANESLGEVYAAWRHDDEPRVVPELVAMIERVKDRLPERETATDPGMTPEAEFVALRAEVERLRAGLYPLSQFTPESADALAKDIGASEDSLFVQWVREKARAEAGEAALAEERAQVARVEAKLLRVERALMQGGQTPDIRARAAMVALAEPAPETTEETP